MRFERLKGGTALVSTEELGNVKSAANAGGCFLPRQAETDEVIAALIGKERLEQPDLAEGCVILMPNTSWEDEEGIEHNSKTLCILTLGLDLVYKSEIPVIFPTPGAIDQVGVEDGRITYIDGIFYVWYCGYDGRDGRACAACSEDLIHWVKTAPLPGDINDHDNKDHVVFPDKINGKYYMLHRPWGKALFGAEHRMPICLAQSESLPGEWKNLGVLIEPRQNPEHAHDWLGAGAPPISLGQGRYLEVYHNAWFEKNGYRQYDAGAMILDFEKGNPLRPASLVTHRMDSIFAPSAENPNECNEELAIDIVFPMSCYVREGYLYCIYGAGDKVTCAARVPFRELLEELEAHPV